MIGGRRLVPFSWHQLLLLQASYQASCHKKREPAMFLTSLQTAFSSVAKWACANTRAYASSAVEASLLTHRYGEIEEQDGEAFGSPQDAPRALVPPDQTARRQDDKTTRRQACVLNLCGKWRLFIEISLISTATEMNAITRKSMSKLVIQPNFRAVGQKLLEWQTFDSCVDEQLLKMPLLIVDNKRK